MDAQRWETQALRENRARRTRRPAVSQDRRPVRSAVWVTLREASDATGIPVGTLGSWVRRGTVDSYLEANGGRKLWVVDLDGVRSRARELGRPISSPPSPPGAVLPPRGGETKLPSPAVSPPPAGVGSPLTGAQIETMIVPIDAWNKMLNQLGNLHEAGQQLAEARERAAKAETEALFLRERLAELRGEDELLAPPASSPPAEAETEQPASPPAAVLPTKGGETEFADPLHEAQPVASAESERPGAATVLWRYLLGSWKSRRR